MSRRNDGTGFTWKLWGGGRQGRGVERNDGAGVVKEKGELEAVELSETAG